MKHLFFLILGTFSLQQSTAQSTLLTITTDPSSKDAVIETYAPNLNGGNDAVVFVSAWTNGGTNNTKRYFFQFDLSGIPAGAIIDSAKIDLYKGSTTLMSNMHQGSNSWAIRRVTQSWTENGITWNNQPTSTAVNKTVVPATTNAFQDFPNIDATMLVEDLLTYGNNGFVAQLESEVTYKAVLLASSDYSTVASLPKLRIWYTLCTANADFTYAANTGNTVNFTNTSSSTAATTYLWDFGDGTFSNQANPTKTYNQSGTYNVCLTSTDSCGTDVTCKNVSLCSPANSTIYYTANGKQIQFQAVPANAISYWWSFGDGNFSNLQNPLYTYTTGGNYTVCLARTDSCGIDTTCQNIVVSGFGIEESTPENYSIYPNPTTHSIRIKQHSTPITLLELYTLSGQKIKTIHTIDEEINLDFLPQGVYILFIKSPNANQFAKIYKL